MTVLLQVATVASSSKASLPSRVQMSWAAHALSMHPKSWWLQLFGRVHLLLLHAALCGAAAHWSQRLALHLLHQVFS